MFAPIALLAAAALQNAGHSHAAMQAAPGAAAPTEIGQSTYAAIGEIVGILVADPATDWSRVNVDALRAHLVDMDNVTLRATSMTEKLPNGARFRVTGGSDTVGSIQRMTRSHFTADNIPGGWKMVTEALPNGASVTVTSDKPADAQRIQALGFFGILTLGAHHQPHHLMIAKGMSH